MYLWWYRAVLPCLDLGPALSITHNVLGDGRPTRSCRGESKVISTPRSYLTVLYCPSLYSSSYLSLLCDASVTQTLLALL
ncbi:hypothetical protein GQ43DRAFT_292084 [Delitschia confertaspora ATCC 74209]|uniref:Secreted protein n=1 Tax=Delitschia confertaspora ATCC 74209 TaxID=1513339 RepID=A0A9P4JUU2_9PLEO|nr:hypothetical protein GQ43DRAFT_292084 [Delitschia confertaspora ATCC 74209]